MVVFFCTSRNCRKLLFQNGCCRFIQRLRTCHPFTAVLLIHSNNWLSLPNWCPTWCSESISATAYTLLITSHFFRTSKSIKVSLHNHATSLAFSLWNEVIPNISHVFFRGVAASFGIHWRDSWRGKALCLKHFLEENSTFCVKRPFHLFLSAGPQNCHWG